MMSNTNNTSGGSNAPLAYFIGHIPRGASEAEVEKVFAPHGASPQFHMHRDNEGRSRGFGWLRFANPVPSLTLRGPFRLRDFELTVEVSNSKMANEAGGAMRGNNNNNNNSSRQQNQHQQRYRKQDDRNAHPMMRSNNRNSHVMSSGQMSMRQGNSMQSHTDRSMNAGQAFPTTSTIQTNNPSSLLQPPVVVGQPTATQAINTNPSLSPSLHNKEETEAERRLQSQTTRREGEHKETKRRRREREERPRERQRHHSASTASKSSRGYEYYNSHSNSASARSSASLSSANSSASVSTLNSHQGSYKDKHSHKHSHRHHRHHRRRSSSLPSSVVGGGGRSPRHHRSRHDEANNKDHNTIGEHSVDRSHDKSSTESHRHHSHKHHRQEPHSNHLSHSLSSLIPAVPTNNLSGNNTPTPSAISSVIPQAAQSQEVTPSHTSTPHPTNLANTTVAMHEMFVCLPMSLCPSQFMCDPRVFTARLDRTRVGALTICGSVLQAANMLSALQPSATSASVGTNTNKVNNNNNYSAPPPPPGPPPPPPPVQSSARIPLASSQNASMPLHSMMQTSKHTSPPPPPPGPPPPPPPNSTAPVGVPTTVNNNMANQRVNVMRPQGRE